MKKLLSIFTLTFFALIFWFNAIVPIAAAEPTTYIVKYDKEDDEWYYRPGSSWDESASTQPRELYYLAQVLKNGDYVVVDSTDGTGTLALDFTLGNITVLPGSNALISCKGVLEYYQLRDSSVSLSANVEKAYVYDNAIANFNNNVNYLEFIFDENPEMVVAVVGTCGELFVRNHANTEIRYHLWSFRDPLVFNDSKLKTAADAYKGNPPSAPAAPIVSPTTTPSAPSSSADEYDDVPKTGESAMFLWMFGLAALCFAGSYSFKKKF